MNQRIPVIDCTDLYHPHQDPGDNFDILAPYAMPEIDLRAVILDTTERARQSPEERQHQDPDQFNNDTGNRDPGFIPITQCNSIFNRQVPAAVSPFRLLESPDDPATDAPPFQQQGSELFLQTLRDSETPVDVLVFCSCRTLAAALNRDADLLQRKIRRLHLSIGTSTGALFDMDETFRKGGPLKQGSAGYLEWNVMLDPHAFVRVLRSTLPMSLYPCSSENGPFALGRHNTFFQLGNLEWILKMEPKLRNYLAYAFTKSQRTDFLHALEGPCPADAEEFFKTRKWHPVWETAVWLEVSGRKLVRRRDGSARIILPGEIRPDDQLVPGSQRPCRLTRIDDTGRFEFEFTNEPSNVSIFDRGEDTVAYEAAASEAVPEWYCSFHP